MSLTANHLLPSRRAAPRNPKELMTVLVQNVEESVNLVIRVRELDEMEPLEAGKSNKVNARFFYERVHRHVRKIISAVRSAK
jgi:hypothetical protein